MTVVHGWAPATRPSTRQSGLAPKAAGVAPPRRNVAVYSTNADPKYASEIRDLETRPLPSIDEALADSCLYDGPNIRDPTQQHPDDFELVNPWTAEDFEVHYAEGGHAPWITPKSVLLVYRSGVTSEEARSTSHEDHVVWIRTSNIISKSRPEEDVPYVWQSRLLLDDLDFPTCSLTALAGDFSAAVLLADSDPYKDCFLKTEFFQWTVSDDEYLRLDIFDRNQSPRCFLSFDAPGGRRLETREKHLSFLRKTRRTLFAGPLVRYSASGLEAAVCGSLVYAFHESEEQAVQWANADPYALALVLDPEKRCIAPYNDLDCTGAQTTSPYPLSDLPDPVLARLVERGLVVLPERLVHRVELNPETGRAVLFNITTVDPRLQGNIDLQVAGSIEISAKALKERKLRVAEFEEDDAANAEYDDDGDDDDTDAGGGGMGGGGDDDGSDRDNYD